ncbi:hypothetical protein CEXT_93171 [Caerostris extrusa]|uniref:Uncharacterized protein n=1 Tax=Caerostris extrusa TaxID=172846 RepID=A0AAV4S0T9_CAEEX|nr:hypothetical protein CEXT_93171 [Caerostris extrusa]
MKSLVGCGRLVDRGPNFLHVVSNNYVVSVRMEKDSWAAENSWTVVQTSPHVASNNYVVFAQMVRSSSQTLLFVNEGNCIKNHRGNKFRYEKTRGLWKIRGPWSKLPSRSFLQLCCFCSIGQVVIIDTIVCQ